MRSDMLKTKKNGQAYDEDDGDNVDDEDEEDGYDGYDGDDVAEDEKEWVGV